MSKRISRIVESLFEEHGIDSMPVDVYALAKKMGVTLTEGFYKETLSGFAVQKRNSMHIGVNKSESLVRRRFTVAHEIGHLMLHGRERVNYDAGSGVVLLRDSHSSDGTDVKEIEANRFAAELLMPETNVREDIAKQGVIDLMSNSKSTQAFIKRMAEKYNVSTQAMTIRLTTLYFS